MTLGFAGAPFDSVATGYDTTFGRSPSGRLFRFRLSERIAQKMPPGSHLLDIGSGTGEDAVWLSGLGFRVVGIDPSPGMVAVAREKAARRQVEVEFQIGSLRDLAPSDRFDAVYSNFGAMNCVPVEAWAAPLSRLVRPGGHAFLVVMGERPLPEFLRRGPTAWRRRRELMATIGDQSIGVTYPSPGAIQAALCQSFRIDRTETMGVMVPAPGMAGWPQRNPIVFGLLASIERAMSRCRALCSFSDHFLVELTRR